MGIGKLTLYPGNSTSTPPETEPLIRSLRKQGMIGQPLNSDTNSFLAGDNFLQLISFVGCSPAVCLTPEADIGNRLCSLTLRGPFDQPQLVWDRNGHPPRCPACSKSMTNWKQHLGNTLIRCDRCGVESGLETITWGKHAGYARIFIEINGVFPGEAIPVDLLFKQLYRDTGFEWRYFFTGHDVGVY